MTKLTTMMSRGAKTLFLSSAMLYGNAVAANETDVLDSYADTAHALYDDSWVEELNLRDAIYALVKSPSAETLTAARSAWFKARAAYQQTEVYRFGNGILTAAESLVRR